MGESDDLESDDITVKDVKLEFTSWIGFTRASIARKEQLKSVMMNGWTPVSYVKRHKFRVWVSIATAKLFLETFNCELHNIM